MPRGGALMASSVQLEFAAVTADERKRERLSIQGRLLYHVLDLGKRSGAEGFTASEVQELARARGIITGEAAAQRAYAWIGPWLAGLAKRKLIRHRLDLLGQSMQRRSVRPASHGNRQDIYCGLPTAGTA